MSDEEITRAADSLSRYLRFMLRFLANGRLATPSVVGFQIRQLESRFRNPRRSLETLRSLGLAYSWEGRKRFREPYGELWALTMDGLGVHYDLLNRGLYENKNAEVREYPSVA